MNTGKENKQVIIALTKGGANLALKLNELLEESTVFLPLRLEKDICSTKKINYFQEWHVTVKNLFYQYEEIIFIMATGIVVRSIAPYLKSKVEDPAVVVLDEKGQYSISLLSGHLGGANDLAVSIADLIGAQPVITTATDVNGKAAVDLLAKELQCQIYPLKRLKIFNRILAEGGQIKVYSQWPELLKKVKLTDSFIEKNWDELEKDKNDDSKKIIITNQNISTEQDNIIVLNPSNLVVGMGCRRGIKKEEALEAIKEIFLKNNLSLNSIKALASVDIKADEQGLQEAAQELKIPFCIVSRADIKKLPVEYESSQFVKKIIGVDGVCQPAAKIVSKMGKILVPKNKMGRVTVAVAEEKYM